MLLTEIMRRPRPAPTGATASVGLELEHPRFTGNEDDLFAEFQVEVEFSVSQSDESVGWKGGADEIQSVTFDEPVRFMGRQYQEGEPVPDELLQYWKPVKGYSDVEDYLLSRAEENAGDSMQDDDGDYEYDNYRDREWEDRY